LVVGANFLDEVFDNLPENQGGGLVFERESPAVLFIID